MKMGNQNENRQSLSKNACPDPRPRVSSALGQEADGRWRECIIQHNQCTRVEHELQMDL